MELPFRRIAVPPRLHLPAPTLGASRSCPPSPAGWRAQRACLRDRDQQAAGVRGAPDGDAATSAARVRVREAERGSIRTVPIRNRSRRLGSAERRVGCEDELCGDWVLTGRSVSACGLHSFSGLFLIKDFLGIWAGKWAGIPS